MGKKVPNPYGKKGKPDHQNLMAKLLEFLTNKFGDAADEYRVDLPSGKKRYADVAALDEDGNPIEFHQVGRTNKNGTPKKRERKAMQDIEKATGKKVFFHALKIILLLLCIYILAHKFS